MMTTSKTPTTVWVVQELIVHESACLEAIFATEDAAKDYVEEQSTDSRHPGFTIEAWGVRE